MVHLDLHFASNAWLAFETAASVDEIRLLPVQDFSGRTVAGIHETGVTCTCPVSFRSATDWMERGREPA